METKQYEKASENEIKIVTTKVEEQIVSIEALKEEKARLEQEIEAVRFVAARDEAKYQALLDVVEKQLLEAGKLNVKEKVVEAVADELIAP